MSARVEELQRKLEALKQAGKKLEEQSGNLSQLREQMSELRASATSQDRSVTVIAGANGAIENIQFTQDALRCSPTQLSTAVMGTLKQAVAEVARKQAEIVSEHTGNQEVLDRVLRTQEEMMGIKVERPEPKATPQPSDEDDDFGDDSFYDNRGF